MSEDSNKLLESLMQMLGDNPAEKLGDMLSSLSRAEHSEEESHTKDEKTENNQTAVGEIDPSLLLTIQGLMGQINQKDQDDRAVLLSAIRPFLSEDRRPQIDQALKLLKLSKLAKTAQDLNLFKELL
ncbi:MAG: hypothetical protein E7393_04655 [Ruminococcaceae bacterium]|nr:hypothetical protein [Oscillospiraceae bacterium]